MSGTNGEQGGSPRLWWCLWMLYVLAWSAALLSTAPITVRNQIFEPEYYFSVTKALHVSAYLVLTLMTSRLPGRVRPWMLLVVLLHGPLTEFLQQFVNRTPSIYDVLFDYCGIALGVALSWRRWAGGSGN